MKDENQMVEKLCSFYVSKWHLVTMILPYINQKIEENSKIITILENDIEQNIKTLLEKLNLKSKSKILEIRWKNISSRKYSDIEELLKKEVSEKQENIILINGCKEYIKSINENVEKWIRKSNSAKITIINSFEMTEFNHNIMEILDEHDYILNTSGKKEISEVFEGYVKKDNIENKKVVRQ